MVIDKFKALLVVTALDQRMLNQYNPNLWNEAYLDDIYIQHRQNLIDLIVELSQGASVDWDELNATMRDWR